MKKTALQIAREMKLPGYAVAALDYERHPQQRTLAFHHLFDAPVRSQRPDRTFSHMGTQRAAFRAAFILSEAIEILEKGFGLEVSLSVAAPNRLAYEAKGSCNAELTNALQSAMADSGKRDIVEVVDGLADLNVVVNGFAIELGVDMMAVDQETLASNLTKLGEDGLPMVADGSDPKWPKGKVLKGPNFVEPQIAMVLGLED